MFFGSSQEHSHHCDKELLFQNQADFADFKFYTVNNTFLSSDASDSLPDPRMFRKIPKNYGEVILECCKKQIIILWNLTKRISARW